MKRAFAPHVASASFLAIDGPEGKIHIQVIGTDFVARAVPVEARLGEQVIERVTLRPDGNGFAGILERAPREGERLYVGYADGDLEPTEVVYRGGSPAPRVA